MLKDDGEFGTENAQVEAVFQTLVKKGLAIVCGQTWAERSGRLITVYKPAPGLTRDDCVALAFDYDASLSVSVDAWDAYDGPPPLPMAFDACDVRGAPLILPRAIA
jgi:hypothetical protein